MIDIEGINLIAQIFGFAIMVVAGGFTVSGLLLFVCGLIKKFTSELRREVKRVREDRNLLKNLIRLHRDGIELTDDQTTKIIELMGNKDDNK